MGETKTPHFYDFGTFGRVPGSPNQYYLSLETPGYLNETKTQSFLKDVIFINLKILDSETFEHIGEGGRQHIMKTRLIIFEHLEYGINIFLKT